MNTIDYGASATAEQKLARATRRRRIAAFVLDHITLTFLIVALVFSALGPSYLDAPPGSMIGIMAVCMVAGSLLYFGKDSFHGTSVGKWIMGITVRDESDQALTPSFGRLFIRNIFLLLWPVEFVVLATSDEKTRLGDRVTRSIVVRDPQPARRGVRAIAGLGILVLITAAMFFVIASAMKSSKAYQTAVREIEASEKIIADTGGILDYGMIPGGNINVTNGQGVADLEIKVIGVIKDVTVNVHLEKEPDGEWKVLSLE